MLRARTLLGLVAAVAIANAAPMVAPSPVAAAGDQLQTNVDVTYQLQPARGVVHVTEVIRLTNQKASKSRSYTCTGYVVGPYGYYPYTTTCTTRTNYYYYRSTFGIEADAKNVKVKASAGSAKLSRGKQTGSWRYVKVDYSRLYYGNSRTLTLSYDLEGGGPRSDTMRRVGWAYTRFCVAGGSGDSGRVRIEVPKGFLLATDRSMSTKVVGDHRVYDSGRLKEKPWGFYSCASGIDPTAVTTSSRTLDDGTAVTVKAWKGDDEWADSANGAVADMAAMTGILGETGLPDTLAIEESLGSAWQTATSTRELAETLVDRGAVLADLTARAWFPADVFDTGWIAAGYAAWGRYLAGVGGQRCDDPGAAGGDEIDLSSWAGRPGAAAAPSEVAAWAAKVEAACWVMRRLDDAMGRERMLATIDAIRHREDAWTPGIAGADAVAGRITWPRWLDLVTEQGLVPAGADAHLAASLLQRFGVATDGAALDAHEAARDAYHAYLAATGAVPDFVMDALRLEDTARAQRAFDTANVALATATSVGDVLPGAVSADGAVASAVRAATCQEDLAGALGLANRQLALAKDVAAAFELEAAPRDALQAIGLIGTEIPGHAAALAAVASVDEAAAAGEAQAIRAVIGEARDAGTIRVAIVGGVLVLVVLAVVAFVIHRRRPRRVTAPAPAAGSDAPRPDSPA